MELQNKTVVVTGAGRGIGRAVALQLARRGGEAIIIASLGSSKRIAAAPLGNAA